MAKGAYLGVPTQHTVRKCPNSWINTIAPSITKKTRIFIIVCMFHLSPLKQNLSPIDQYLIIDQ